MINNVIYSFVGVECYDIIIYMARILSAKKSSVLIVDNSESKSLAVCVPGGFEASPRTLVDYKGITLVKDLMNIPSNKFDVVLVYYGRHGKFVAQNSTETFIVLDYQKHSALSILDTEYPDDVPVTVIYRDQAFTKITKDAIVTYLEELDFQIDDSLYVEDTAEDIENRVLCQYNFFQPFSTISASMQELICELLDISDKELKAYLKATAKRR